MLPLYLLAVVLPYSIRASSGHYDFAVGLGATWVAVWHILFAIYVTREALRIGRRERLEFMRWVLTPWTSAIGIMFSLAPPGGYNTYAVEYFLLTGSCVAGAVLCLGACALSLVRGKFQPMALVTGVWFASSAAINGLSRWIYSAPDWQAQWLRLNWWESAVHLGCLAAWGWLVWRDEC